SWRAPALPIAVCRTPQRRVYRGRQAANGRGSHFEHDGSRSARGLPADDSDGRGVGQRSHRPTDLKIGVMATKPRCYVASPLGFTEAGRVYYRKVFLPALAAVVEPIDPWAYLGDVESV